jgi:hypothetical protein
LRVRARYLRLITSVALFASATYAANITGGAITENTGLLNNTDALNIFGNNFSITWADQLSSAPDPAACVATPTCTNDFSQMLSEASPGGLLPILITYNGNIYNKLGGYNATLDLTISSGAYTVPLSNVGTNRIPLYLALWSGVPFTVTGSFSVFQGSTLVVTDTLSGFGLAFGSNGPNTARGLGPTSFTYAFGDVPEPATLGLVGAGLLAAWYRRRNVA